jgi:hypothetical protein
MGQVPPHPDRLKDDIVASATRSRSVIEWSCSIFTECSIEHDLRSLGGPPDPDMMVQFPQEGLVLRLPPPKPVAADRVPIEVHLHPHQPMQPVLINLEAPTQHLHRPHRTGPPSMRSSRGSNRVSVVASSPLRPGDSSRWCTNWTRPGPSQCRATTPRSSTATTWPGPSPASGRRERPC